MCTVTFMFVVMRFICLFIYSLPRPLPTANWQTQRHNRTSVERVLVTWLRIITERQ